MIYSNFHTHCKFCDGKGELEDYVKKAIELGFVSIGFSSHGPIHMQNKWNMKREDLETYLETIDSLKTKYKNEIEVYAGLELDYFLETAQSDYNFIRNLNLDYTIGSVHYMRNKSTGEYLTVDGPQEDYSRIIKEFFSGDVKEFVKAYYELVRKMILELHPSIVGHLDLIKKNNKESLYFDENEQWYRDEVLKTLELIKKSNCILEINTGGISRGYMKFPYPSKWILIECKKLNIPLTLNADAHLPENLSTYFTETVDVLKDLGFDKLFTMKNGAWTEIKI